MFSAGYPLEYSGKSAMKETRPKAASTAMSLLNIITRQGGVRMSRCGQYRDSVPENNTEHYENVRGGLL